MQVNVVLIRHGVQVSNDWELTNKTTEIVDNERGLYLLVDRPKAYR